MQQLLSPFHPLPDALKSWHFLKRPHEEAVDKTKSCGVPLFVSCIPTTHILVHSTYLEFHPQPDFPIKVELGPRRKQQLFSLQGLGVRLLTFGLVGWIVFPSRNERLIPLSIKSSSKCPAKTSKLQLARVLRRLRSPHDSRLSLTTICPANGISAMSAATLLRLSM